MSWSNVWEDLLGPPLLILLFLLWLLFLVLRKIRELRSREYEAAVEMTQELDPRSGAESPPQEPNVKGTAPMASGYSRVVKYQPPPPAALEGSDLGGPESGSDSEVSCGDMAEEVLGDSVWEGAGRKDMV
ncbi:hypothetical protein TeGR_g4111 [Tetraparma gracilis]|uniref:Uncharacterized protein n=1 Tax=Tetraparma gracilis TaxID=2962635 RepID=A0ABQ6MZU4_9STRA|nr:hypothetical protein TeGR_g4111 [Tetraparma gracilis]